MNISVLGAGRVGSAIIKDLAGEAGFHVTAVDNNQKNLDKIKSEAPVKAICSDMQKIGNIQSAVSESDFVICAVPGFMGFETLKNIIKAGKNAVDISFFSEDPFLLDELAKNQGVAAIVDCGVAPGLCNIIAGYVDTLLDRIESYTCYVGGLPRIREWPYEYKAVFSPSDVIEEYTRPARFKEYGHEKILPALSELELINLPDMGTLEAFNTDGLRSLIHTLDIPFMKEKTLRYPGHAELMRIFRETGFFNTEAVAVEGHKIKPLDFTSKLLFDKWKLKQKEEDITVMQVKITGEKDGKKYCYIYDLFDRYDHKTQTSAMARTTGYTCTIAARQLISGLYRKKGISPPEFIGRTKGCYENLLEEYAKRNIRLSNTIIEMS